MNSTDRDTDSARSHEFTTAHAELVELILMCAHARFRIIDTHVSAEDFFREMRHYFTAVLAARPGSDSWQAVRDELYQRWGWALLDEPEELRVMTNPRRAHVTITDSRIVCPHCFDP